LLQSPNDSTWGLISCHTNDLGEGRSVTAASRRLALAYRRF
jgi:hypothetical protein